ncbi:MaoC family dehydratase [Streptomyces sp. NRRL B-24484]|uniref:MaoC family dehydratase n=1 Tax=Streptomyces sp. NRRL B-24484 TaxID=1463833 RepID=UPI0004BF3FC5|nr:MaoC family dehydratase [Streptomyces sp. NRRL B-24484]
MTTFASLADLKAAVGTELGTSEWHTIGQEQVNLFAEATGDHQWIHVDPARAKESPFGGTIAHGYLTLSLIPVLAKECYGVEGIAMALNYGSEKVRFPSPVPVGTAVRATAELLSADEVAGGVQALVRFTIRSEGSPKPHCVAETITRFYAA